MMILPWQQAVGSLPKNSFKHLEIYLHRNEDL
jgi:hypothetical protein